MTCGNCGAAAIQGPNGSWICSNQCGWSSGVAPSPSVGFGHDHRAAVGTRAYSGCAPQ